MSETTMHRPVIAIAFGVAAGLLPDVAGPLVAMCLVVLVGIDLATRRDDDA